MNACAVDGAVIVPMTAEMISQVAEIHREAFQGYMNARLGRGYIRAFLGWFCRARDSIALVALGGSGQVIGYVVGTPWDHHEQMQRDLVWPVIRAVALRPWLLLERGSIHRAVSRLRLIIGRKDSCGQSKGFELPEPTVALVAIGVLSSVRVKGIGQHLTRAFETRARELKMGSMLLAVYQDNVIARKLYEKCGWEPLVSRGSDRAMFYAKPLV